MTRHAIHPGICGPNCIFPRRIVPVPPDQEIRLGIQRRAATTAAPRKMPSRNQFQDCELQDRSQPEVGLHDISIRPASA